MRKRTIGILAVVLISSVLLVIRMLNEEEPVVDRESEIPEDAVKVTPEEDLFPPILHSYEYEEPVPMPGPINTAGGEDSPFMAPDGDSFYFFFTPDVTVPAEKQVTDKVTGIYVSYLVDDGWSIPERVILQDRGKLALDGCPCVKDNVLWFCSAREGYTGVRFFTAECVDGRWQNWRSVGEKLTFDYEVGELHVTTDELYFHSGRTDGKGQLDIWVSRNVDGEWLEPLNLETVNTAQSEGWPFVSPEGDELWFTRFHRGSPAIFRSERTNGEWQEPELIVSQFAAEPTLDSEGNLYFCHHFFEDGEMIEADIYVAYRKPTEHIEPIDSPGSPSRGFYKGFLPIPAEGQGFDEVYQEASRSVEFVPVWGRPTPFYGMAEELSGSWGDTFVEKLIRGNGMFPLVHFSFFGPDLTLKAPPEMYDATLSDPAWRQAYKKAVVDVVRSSKPLYLSLGNEVNRWYEKYGVNESSPDGFQHFVSLYEEIYDVVEGMSPETKVFCVFARENVAELREADLEVLSMFNSDKIDVLVFTSYPHAVKAINGLGDIPDDYYDRAFEHFPYKPLGFSELAWPSLEAYGGEQGQADFISHVTGRLTKDQGIDLRLLGWSWLHDVDENDHTGLKKRDGSEKIAFEVWENL